MMDPDSKRTFTGSDGTVGFISARDGQNKQVGKGMAQGLSNLKAVFEK